MEYSKIIKEVGRGKNHARDLDEETARALYARMLNGEVPELELGGILIALRIKGEGEAEMKGFYAAMQQHTLRLTPPAGKPMPIVIPSYNGARKQANLTPLLAMLLHKLGFPVVVHGVSHDPTRVLYERQTEMAAEAVVLPTSKDPEVTARWIERCVAGVEPVPTSLKIQLACCLVACGEVTSLEQGLSRVNDCW